MWINAPTAADYAQVSNRNYTVGTEPPQNPAVGDQWLDTAARSLWVCFHAGRWSLAGTPNGSVVAPRARPAVADAGVRTLFTGQVAAAGDFDWVDLPLAVRSGEVLQTDYMAVELRAESERLPGAVMAKIVPVAQIHPNAADEVPGGASDSFTAWQPTRQMTLYTARTADGVQLRIAQQSAAQGIETLTVVGLAPSGFSTSSVYTLATLGAGAAGTWGQLAASAASATIPDLLALTGFGNGRGNGRAVAQMVSRAAHKALGTNDDASVSGGDDYIAVGDGPDTVYFARRVSGANEFLRGSCESSPLGFAGMLGFSRGNAVVLETDTLFSGDVTPAAAGQWSAEQAFRADFDADDYHFFEFVIHNDASAGAGDGAGRVLMFVTGDAFRSLEIDTATDVAGSPRLLGYAEDDDFAIARTANGVRLGIENVSSAGAQTARAANPLTVYGHRWSA